MGGCLSARDLSVGSALKLSRRWLVDPCKGSIWAVQLLVLGIESLTKSSIEQASCALFFSRKPVDS